MSSKNNLPNRLENAALGYFIGSKLGNAGLGAAIGGLGNPINFGGLNSSLGIRGGGVKRHCTRQFTQKYMTRGSPPYPANECKGSVKLGNDGYLYESRNASNGVHRWIREDFKRSPLSKRKSPKKKTSSPKLKKRNSPKKRCANGFKKVGTKCIKK